MANDTYEQALKNLADSGHVIEAGWLALDAAVLPPNATEIQRREMRKAFFAGAQHLYASIMNIMDPEGEPTENDVRRMEMIHVELEAWGDSLKREAKGMKDAI